jgi:hypothetical protein
MGPIKKVMVDDPFEQILHRTEKLLVANGNSKHAPN